MMGIEIRKARGEDAKAVIKYMIDLLQEERVPLPLYPDEYGQDEEKYAELLNKIHQSPSELFAIAHLGNELVGVTNLKAGSRKSTEHDLSIGISVKSQFRQQGIGTKLIEFALQYSKTIVSAKSLSLTVWKSNPSAIRLYEKYGFKKCGERKFSTYKYGEFQAVIEMEREI